MIRILELLYFFEGGGGIRIIRWLTALLLFFLLAYWFDSHELRNFYSPEAMEAAQVARNLANGKGFSTYTIRPLTITLIERKLGLEPAIGNQPHPDLSQPPLYPTVLALLFRLLPERFTTFTDSYRNPPEVTIAVFNQFLLFLSALLIYRVGKRLFDSEVAFLATTMFIVSDIIWEFSASGLSTMLCILLVLFLVSSLISAEEAFRLKSPRSIEIITRGLCIGIIIGAATLTRYELIFLIVPTLFFSVVCLKRKRLVFTFSMIVGIFLLVSPWLWRNYHVSNTLLGLRSYAIIQATPSFPGSTLERTLTPDIASIGIGEIYGKFVSGLERIVKNQLPSLGGHWLGGLFLAGLILKYRNPTIARVRMWIVVSLIILTIVEALCWTWITQKLPLINTENLLIILSPLVLLYGASLLVLILDQMELPIPELRQLFKALFIFVAFIPLLVRFLPPFTPPTSYPPYFAPWIRSHSQLIKPNELMISDIPWAVGWYGQRNCVWIPIKLIPYFYEIHDHRKPIAALYLTQETADVRFQSQILQDPYYEWSRFMLDVLLHQRVPTGFPLKYARERYLPEQLLLCDRPRWLEQTNQQSMSENSTNK